MAGKDSEPVQLALGGLAVAITYGVGTLIGHHAG
jgi:hypothetical protein